MQLLIQALQGIGAKYRCGPENRLLVRIHTLLVLFYENRQFLPGDFHLRLAVNVLDGCSDLGVAVLVERTDLDVLDDAVARVRKIALEREVALEQYTEPDVLHISLHLYVYEHFTSQL